MKKILLTLFTFVLALNAAAQEQPVLNGKIGSNIEWEYFSDEESEQEILIVTGTGKINYDSNTIALWNKEYKVKVPGYPVLTFSIKQNVTKIIIGKGITQIDQSIFKGFNNVTSVEFPVSLTSIGNSAFQNCTKLTSVDLSTSSSLKSIGSSAFQACTGLTSIEIPESVTDFGTQIFSGCTNLTNTCKHIIIEVDSETVGERYTISKDVKYIEGGAFTNCNNLKYLIYEGSPKIGGDIMDGQTRESIKITAMPSNSLNINEVNCGPNRNLTKDVYIKKDKYTSYAFLHDVTIPSGVAAYTAKIDGKNVTLTRIKTGKIQAEVGVFLKATNDGEYDFSNGPDAPKADDNDLVGVVEEKQLTKADQAYVLKTDVNGIQKFYLVDSDIKIGKFKAYLTAVGHEAKTFSIFNVDETTNIEETEQEKEEPINSRTEIYNMAGQKLSTTQKGLNIVNGKIVIK